MRPDDLVRLSHMIEAGEAALEFARGRNRADLDADRMLVFALVRAVEVMGEAAGRITPNPARRSLRHGRRSSRCEIG
jgi:uncharacterized protein with HEPN domain